MARTEQSAHNRDRILQAAERLFAEKGFDATSVSSVAQAAGVNKALVYYYFDSKDDLLASLFTDMLDEMRSDAEPAADSASLTEKVASEIASLSDRRRTLVLLLTQALKQGNESPALFEAADEMIEKELTARGFSSRSEENSTSADRRKAIVHEFFTGIIPVVAFVTLRDRFCSHFDIDVQEADALFLDALERSHFNSHVEPQNDE